MIRDTKEARIVGVQGRQDHLSRIIVVVIFTTRITSMGASTNLRMRFGSVSQRHIFISTAPLRLAVEANICNALLGTRRKHDRSVLHSTAPIVLLSREESLISLVKAGLIQRLCTIVVIIASLRENSRLQLMRLLQLMMNLEEHLI